MKEEDLYKIGNRLYNHESDPPSDGWKKIAGVIHTPRSPATFTWWTKRLWIPLILMVPVTWYVIAPDRDAKDPLITEAVTHGAPGQQPGPREKDAPATDSGLTADESVEAHLSMNDGIDTSLTSQLSGAGDHSIIMLATTDGLTQARDSTSLHAVVEKIEEEAPGEETKEETRRGVWRINLSFTPSYVARSVKPIADDEVFVTKFGKDDRNLAQRIGVGFAIGAGKAITKDLYVDAHLTFSQSKQNTFFSYSTGKIDTLVAVQQPDETIRLTPVYAEHHRGMKSQYTYGGLRIAATYYFLTKPHGRYNLLFAAGVNYLLSVDIQERVEGQWIDLPSKDLHKFNYALTVGTGYTLDIHEQWSLMINPVLTYNIRQVKNSDLPYRLNQRPFGLNIMLSRRLGKY